MCCRSRSSRSAWPVCSIDLIHLLSLQVERLSGLVERAKELNLDAQNRLDVINSSVNINTRIVKFFELVENDLYGKLQKSNAQIAVHRGQASYGGYGSDVPLQ